ncbi:MAG: class IV adenylate cyclase [Bacteroidetes bacterium]|nr:class IV adenylate cyclase [Bacteroidota bacterium]
MPAKNFEFKAKAKNIPELENKLLGLNPLFIGEDNQTDTYFNVSNGRLKLREGNIENALIYYERENTGNAKQSNIILYQHKPDVSLKEILIKVNGIKVVVTKKRKIYFIDNVKFHFDTITELGTFIEVEAIDRTGEIGIKTLQQQCNHYADFFGIAASDYIAFSYSDMILEKVKQA